MFHTNLKYNVSFFVLCAIIAAVARVLALPARLWRANLFQPFTFWWTMTTFGERLKTERKRLQLTQERMAEVGGVRKNTQLLYEAGRNTPDADYLMRVIAIGVDMHFLFQGERGVAALSKDERALLALLESATPQARAVMIASLSLLRRLDPGETSGQVGAEGILRATQLVEQFLQMDEEERRALEEVIKQVGGLAARPQPPLPPAAV
jgi:transcriptional regulator with XRE-family HTH domain